MINWLYRWKFLNWQKNANWWIWIPIKRIDGGVRITVMRMRKTTNIREWTEYSAPQVRQATRERCRWTYPVISWELYLHIPLTSKRRVLADRCASGFRSYLSVSPSLVFVTKSIEFLRKRDCKLVQEKGIRSKFLYFLAFIFRELSKTCYTIYWFVINYLYGTQENTLISVIFLFIFSFISLLMS